MRPLQNLFPAADYPQLLVGLDAPDDAAVYQLNDEQAVIATMDFFPPIVDDARAFGAIAAANALSDVYAMGGQPLFAINLVGWPEALPHALLTEVLRGGAESVREAGAVLAGGHSVVDEEPKYGLAAFGLAQPSEILAKGGAQIGDALVLTKALGTGVITTAAKFDACSPERLDTAIASMCRLNAAAARAARQHQARAMTDITGYGLVGHALEMARAGAVDFHFQLATIPWLPGAEEYAAAGHLPGGIARNREYYGQDVHTPASISAPHYDLLYDPQTSGGLLISLPAQEAAALISELGASGHAVALVGEARAGNGRLHFHAG